MSSTAAPFSASSRQHVESIVVVRIDNRSHGLLFFALLGKLIRTYRQPVCVLSFAIPVSQDALHVSGEAFVEPDIRPVASLNIVAKPMLSQFHAKQISVRKVGFRARIVERRVSQGRCATFLLAANG